MPNGEAIIAATKTIRQPYTLTFNAQGGSGASLKSRVVFAGLTYGVLPEVKRDGYHFDGWYTQAEGGEKVTAQTTVSLRQDHTLYAHWSRIPGMYFMSFDSQGGDGASPESRIVSAGQTYGALPEVKRGGYRFDGWYTRAVGGEKVTAETEVLQEDHTLYAHWTRTIPEGMNPCGENAYWRFDEATGTLTIGGSGPMYDGADALDYIEKYKETIRNVVVEGGVTKIGAGAFFNCSNLVRVRLDKGVKEIGNNAFAFCSALTKLYLPDGLERIGQFAFAACVSLETVVLPVGLTQINNEAFYGDTSLRHVGVSTSIETRNVCIGWYISKDNPAHNIDVYYPGTEEEWKNAYFDGLFSGGQGRKLPLVYHWGTRGPFIVEFSEVAPNEVDIIDPDDLLEGGSVLAATYDGTGRMTKLRQGTVRADAVAFDGPLEVGDTVFFLDAEGKPICEKLIPDFSGQVQIEPLRQLFYPLMTLYAI